MPSIAVGNRTISGNVNTSELKDKNYEYNYPGELNLRPGTDLHDEIATAILSRAIMSYSDVSNRFESWNQVDETLTAYKWADAEEKEIEENDPRKPTSIVIPFSYALLETLTTYCYKALAQPPIFRYEGVGPEDTYGAILLEMLVDLHCKKSKIPLNLHTLFRDSLSYGIGTVVPGWEVRTGRKRVKQVGSVYDVGGNETYRTSDIQVVEGATLYEGNYLYNVDPYRLLPDTNQPSHEVQKMEFIGWTEVSNKMELLQDEEYGTELFNVKYLNDRKLVKDLFGDDSSRDLKTGMRSGGDYGDYSNPVELITMYITLIPKEWKLGDGEIPEKWVFTLANGEIIIRAQPLDFDHGLYPIACATPDFDGYGTLPLSRLEILSGMQNVLDWLFNSRITNVRKSVNDMLVVDPWLVNYDDVANPGAGKLIKLRRPAWGKGVEGAITQLRVDDITQNHINDMGVIMEAMRQVSAVDESMQGMLRKGGPERLTKAEYQGTAASGVSRLERIASVIGMQAMQDIGYFFAAHAQQFMSQGLKRKVLGEWRERLQEVIKSGQAPANAEDMVKNGSTNIEVDDIVIDYDITVKDGSVPGGNFNEGWLQIYQMMLENPEAVKEYDPNRVFEFIAMNMGAKNIADFKRGDQLQIMRDEDVQKQAQAGNLRRT